MVRIATVEKKDSRMKAAILLTVLCILFLGGCGSMSNVQQIPTPLPTIRPTATTNTPLAPTPTPIPTITPTVAPTTNARSATAPTSLPRLGDPIQAWVSYYGSFQDISTTQERLYTFVDDTGASDESITVGYDPTQHNRVFTLSLHTVNGTTWESTNTAMNQNVQKYLPSDAVVQTRALQQGGIVEAYKSTTLQNEFPPLYFIDQNGNAVDSGICNIFYKYTDTSQSIDHATISLGMVYGL